MSETFIKVLGDAPLAFNNALYALCDFETLQRKNLSLHDFVQIAKKNNVKLVQYRDKLSSISSQKEHLLYLKTHLDVPIIINDKLELLDHADGIHLGQEDLAELKNNHFNVTSNMVVFKLLRKKYSHKLFGLSTHNEMEILEANALDLDMIGLGAYRNTTTKNVNDILGDKLPYLAKISKHPVCAIGGVLKHDVLEHVTFNVIGSHLYEN